MYQGYEDSRFVNAVDTKFHCSICVNVLKEPVQCRSNEHRFCSPCIRRHLERNSKNCPECKEELTIETLRETPRTVVDFLSKLKISCDYAERGCLEEVQLGALESHVIECDFFPLACSNDGCSELVNKRDLEDHESNACNSRKVKCDECGEEMAKRKYGTHGCALRAEMVGMKGNWTETKDRLDGALGMLDGAMDELKFISSEVKKLGEMKEEMKLMTNNVNNIKHSLQSLHNSGRNIMHSRNDVVVIGGAYDKPLSFVERFTWFDGKWTSLEQLKESRVGATAVVFDNQILISGGGTRTGITDSMEIMDTNEKPERWVEFPAKLPLKCHGHKCVVYGGCLLVIGGLTNEGRVSDAIHEVLLVPPYSSRLLCRMRQRRCYHGVELFGDKILIAGGMTSTDRKDILRDVTVYDVSKNECSDMAPLPFAVCSMATVGWDDNVILVGGMDGTGNAVDAVVAYDVRTGKSKALPSMRSRRAGCAAVVSRNSIVVMGGSCEEDEADEEVLDLVECFSFLFHTWDVLPAMIEPRAFTTAV